MKKLRNNRGESLVEVLASILVGTLSVTLLFGCIMTSSKLDTDARELDKEHYEALSDADAQAAESVGVGTVTIKNDDKEAAPSIAIYGGEGMFSYKAYTPGG